MGKTYIIAEAGVNHKGDIQLAKKLIDEAIKNACEAIDDIILKGFDHAMNFFNRK